MRSWSESRALAVKFLVLLAAVLPPALFAALLHGPVLSLAGKRLQRQAELEAFRENVYRSDWLDSARIALEAEVQGLRAFQGRMRQALAPRDRAEALSDSLRREAQSLGCEVLRLSAARDSSEGLGRIRMRMEGRTDFAAALRLFRHWREQRPEVYYEEVLLRPVSGAGRNMAVQISMVVHLEGNP